MGNVMQKDGTIAQHARDLHRMTSRWPSDYSLFPKFKEHTSGTRIYSDNGVKLNYAGNWLNGKGHDFYQARLNKLVLCSDKCLHIFDDYVEKRSASMPLNSLLYVLSNVNKQIFIPL
ncbi:hypothetical protein AVEN_22554-1 [Araneus ventricosus]|uniref:Uncharacterized protein n=1 Tax=Araneus ventricosus TaxID=182803 RepID=A0A4Y2E8N4_ARAVE|nr:hypothetical protein AVEN_22554-1 [Araneus ventricosus]